MLKMLLAAEAWRLGGMLLGDAVLCEQRTPLWHLLGCPQGCHPLPKPKPESIQSRAPQHRQPLPQVDIHPRHRGEHGEGLWRNLFLHLIWQG